MKKKIKILKKYGVDRINLGVQSTNEKILKLHGREYQKFSEVENLVHLIKTNLPNTLSNADLLIGLRKQSLRTILRSIDDLMKLGISSITLYRLNFDGQKNPDFEKKLTSFVRVVITKTRTLAEKHGYFIKSFCDYWEHQYQIFNKKDYEAFVNSSRAKPFSSYRDTSTDYLSLFGIGPKSRSEIYGHLKYEMLYPKHLENNNYDMNFFSFNPHKKVALGNTINEKYIIMLKIANILTKESCIIFDAISPKEYRTKFKAVCSKINYSTDDSYRVFVGKTRMEKWHFLLRFLQKYQEIFE